MTKPVIEHPGGEPPADLHIEDIVVGEGAEARAAMYALSQRPEWQEDALVARFRSEILPQLDASQLMLEPWLQPSAEHRVPLRLQPALTTIG